MSDQPDEHPDTEACLLRLRDVLENARAMPLSASVMVNREEFTALLEDALAAFPEELRQARYLLRQREEVIARAEREAERIVEAARVRAERMVERTEVVREARRRADGIVETAEQEAAHLRNEAEDYVDRKLASFEVVLERTMQQVQKGRERLEVQVTGLGEEEEPAGEGPGFFDQDLT